MMLQAFAASTAQVAADRFGASWEWYIIRGAGFTAAALLILLMISGIGQVTGFTYRFFEPVKAWAIHKALGIALCFAIAVHVLFILLDHFVPFTIPQVLVPFLSHYTNGSKLFGLSVGSLAVAFGIFAAYGVAIIIASSLGWIDSKKKTWRWLHYLSYVVMLFVFLHALTVGSDLRYGVFRDIWILLMLIVLVATISRLMRVGTLRRKD